MSLRFEPPDDKTNKMTFVPSEDSDQPGHPPSLVFAVRMEKHWVFSYPLSAQRRLIRLGGCPGWSESFSHAQAHFFLWISIATEIPKLFALNREISEKKKQNKQNKTKPRHPLNDKRSRAVFKDRSTRPKWVNDDTVSISDNHTCINRTDLQKFLEAVGSEHEFAQGTLLNKSVSTRWDFAGAFSFVVTVVTTIGNTCEPRHDKTNKVSVRPAKTQISLGIRPVWSESSLSAWRNLGSLATH